MEEMIVSFDNEFIQKNSGSVSLAEVQEIGGVVAVKNHNIASSVIWQRRSTRRRDEEADCWVPCAETITEEPFILVKHSGQDFAAMIGNGRLVALVNDIRRLHPEKKFIFMIEGIEKVYRTNLQKTNQQFQAAVRGEQDPSSRSNSFPQLPDKDVIDSKLLWLQFHVRCQVQHAKTPSETAEWIAAISKEIAVIPENKYV